MALTSGSVHTIASLLPAAPPALDTSTRGLLIAGATLLITNFVLTTFLGLILLPKQLRNRNNFWAAYLASIIGGPALGATVGRGGAILLITALGSVLFAALVLIVARQRGSGSGPAG